MGSKLIEAAKALLAQLPSPQHKIWPSYHARLEVEALSRAVNQSERAGALDEPDVAALLEWKDAVINGLAVARILTVDHEHDPHRALYDLAVALLKRGRAEVLVRGTSVSSKISANMFATLADYEAAAKMDRQAPHQQRVTAERDELSERLTRLTTFTSGEVFRSLPHAESIRLLKQASVMSMYLAVLDERIAAFDAN